MIFFVSSFLNTPWGDTLLINPGPHKLLSGGVAGLVDPFTGDDLYDSLEEDVDIEPQRPVVNVPYVQFELNFPGYVVAPIDLRPACYAGECVHTAGLFGGVAVEVLHQQRARPDETHLAPKHIVKLRQFVDAAGPQKFAEEGQPVFIGEQFSLGIRLIRHRAEFIHAERLPFISRADLAEENRRTVEEAHEQGCERQQGGDENQAGNGERQIENAFAFRNARREKLAGHTGIVPKSMGGLD
jgi:hypothetical protein